MGFFDGILDKLGLGHASAAPASQEAPAASAAPAPEEATPSSAPITVVDVMAQLEKLAAEHSQKLHWKRSIADLLRLLDIDNSYAARKELAIELGCPAEKMDDSAQMNMWLHKTVLQKIADNGGNIPQQLLD